jgi:hypothetical protein
MIDARNLKQYLLSISIEHTLKSRIMMKTTIRMPSAIAVAAADVFHESRWVLAYSSALVLSDLPVVNSNQENLRKCNA